MSKSKVGYYEEGEYKAKFKGSHTEEYKSWYEMIRRCYHKNRQNYKYYGGRGVTVCEEWLYFQEYAKWYNERKGLLKDGVKYSVDKDLIGSGLMYSPNNCILIPVQVNNQIKGLNKGEFLRKPHNMYVGRIPVNGYRLAIRGFKDKNLSQDVCEHLHNFKINTLVKLLLEYRLCCKDVNFKDLYYYDFDEDTSKEVKRCELILENKLKDFIANI